MNSEHRFPEQSEKLWSSFFYISGISTLIVWNSVLSLTGYWTQKIKPGIQNYYGFYFMIGSFLSFLFYEKINSKIGWFVQIVVWPILMTLIFFIYILVGECLSTSDLETTRAAIFLIGCFIQGFINNCLQTTISRYVFAFGPTEISSYTAGTGIAGFGVALVAFILTYCPISVTSQFGVYQILVTFILIFIQYNFRKYHNKYVRCYNGTKPKTSDEIPDIFIDFSDQSSHSFTKNTADMDKELGYIDSETDKKLLMVDSESAKKRHSTLPTAINIHVKIENVLKINQRKEYWSERLYAFKIIHPFAFMMVLTYTVTLGCFPALNFLIGIGMPRNHEYPLIVLIFNIFDTIGKYGYKQTPMTDSKSLYLYGMLRNVLLPLGFAICVVFRENAFWGNSAVAVVQNILQALTNGHFTTAVFANSTERLDDNYKKFSAFILVFSVLFGLAYGALVDYLSLL